MASDDLSAQVLSENIADNFTILGKLGEGATGSVYLARENATSEEVAIKLLTKDLLSDPRSIEGFDREATAVSKLSHPNLVCIRDHGVPLRGAPYLIMDYITGVDLATILARHGALSAAEVVDIFTQVATALAYAHERGILHRDLKPANIIVSAEGVCPIKVVDFGMSRLIKKWQRSSQATEAETAELIGCPYYMSPEQCQGENLDARSDIYSLGCVMYEALSGHPPFEQRNPVKVILSHMKEKPRRIAVASGQQSTVESVIFKCLEKDPNHRYQSARKVMDDLHRIKSGRSPRSMLAGQLTSFNTSGKYIALCIIVLLLVGFLVMLSKRQTQHTPDVPPTAKLPDGTFLDEMTGATKGSVLLSQLLSHKEAKVLEVGALFRPTTVVWLR